MRDTKDFWTEPEAGKRPATRRTGSQKGSHFLVPALQQKNHHEIFLNEFRNAR
jgi:hypothetical protein